MVVAVASYLFAYNTIGSIANAENQIQLPKNEIAIKSYGEKQSGNLTLYRVKTDTKQSIVEISTVKTKSVYFPVIVKIPEDTTRRQIHVAKIPMEPRLLSIPMTTLSSEQPIGAMSASI